MRITIDNGDGRGPVDYTACVSDKGPLTIQRALNAPSRCVGELLIGSGGVTVPSRNGRVSVTSEDGTVLFTGYVATEPVQVYGGENSSGPVYQVRLSAVSDEWLLDKAGSGTGLVNETVAGMDGRALLAQLTSRVLDGSSILTLETTGVAARAAGVLELQPSGRWSQNAGAVASATYASYRAVNAQVQFQPAGVVTHAFSDADGSLNVAEFQTGALRELANDVTLSGAEEPAAYISESFAGDGTTDVFELSEAAFRGSNGTLVRDSFQGSAIDSSQWQVSDSGSALSLTSAGLTVRGGTGRDGQTTLTALNDVEMGGSLLVQMSGVTVGSASDGMLGAFYEGTPVLANCFAGYRVRQGNSGGGNATILVPVINGVETGTAFTPLSGHSYTLRLRLHSVEMLRVGQPFYCMVDGVVETFGSGSGLDAPMDVVFDLVDEGVSSNTPATVLYDSAAAGAPLTDSPALCSFVAVNATSLTASIGGIEITRPGSLWLVSTLADGSKQTRMAGAAGQGVDCEASYGSSAGSVAKVTFFAGRVPAAGERVTAFYRNGQRSVARLANAASIVAEASGGVNGVSRWVGRVVQPLARSSADCENAASAVLAFATSRSAALEGTYAVVNPAADVWPGDVLAITSNGVTSALLVRSVVIEDGHALAEVRRYVIRFANDWATELTDGLGLKLSESIAKDAVLPTSAESSPGSVLANLQQLSLVSVSETVLQVDAGCDPPAGGGFEVRRKDWAFGMGVDPADLVLRSPVRGFSIPRAAQMERYYVRMYDANVPATYSRFSSAVFVTAPVS